VILGGGRANFLPNTMADPEYANQKGRRLDGRNLVEEWKVQAPNRTLITMRAGFKAFDWNSQGQVFGLFEPSPHAVRP
jgi:alkaline phosphatase